MGSTSDAKSWSERGPFLAKFEGGLAASGKPQGSQKRSGRTGCPATPYLYFMPVPRPVLSRRAPAGAGGRGTSAARDLGPDPPPPGGFPSPTPAGPLLPPPGPGRGPHRRSSLLRLRRFCSVHAIDTCMPAGQGERGGSEGAGKPEVDAPVMAGRPGKAGRLRRLLRKLPDRLGPRGRAAGGRGLCSCEGAVRGGGGQGQRCSDTGGSGARDGRGDG